MKKLKPWPKLKAGDLVATVSLSWGGAGDEEILWRYEQGKKQLEEALGVRVIAMPNALKGTEYVYNHPEARAEDLMAAFRNPEIKAIIANIGGIESVRITPYIDYEVIRGNPKPFIGYSDSTTTHLLCFKAGIQSIYGPCLLVDFAENNGIYGYTLDSLRKILFEDPNEYEVIPAESWTSEFLEWKVENKDTSRKLKNELHGLQVVHGEGKVTGRLLGGCLEVFDTHRGTELFPAIEDFEGAVLFFETSEDTPPPWYVETVLRTYGNMGILQVIKGMIWGKPMDEKYYDAYQVEIKKVLAEFGLEQLPVLYNVNFGHTEPKISLVYGDAVTIDCDEGRLIYGSDQ